MDWQEVIDNAVKVERAEAMKTSQQLMLGELILKLEAITDKSKLIIFDDGRYHPTGIDSWRGSYDELAIEYAEERREGKYSAGAFLVLLKGAIGSKFGGYKGGEFLMGKTTPVWIANYGETSGFKHDGDIYTQAVIDVSQDEHNVIIETKPIEY